jgi:hypothetical protein
MNQMQLIYLSLIANAALLLAAIWQGIRLRRLGRVRKEFFSAGLNKDIEQILVDQNRAITKNSLELTQLDDSLTRLYKDNRSNLQKIGFLRFNPFDDAGGNMSFVLALLDGQDDGVVISSLHGRDGTRVYAKSVKAGGSESKLTEEEEQAIKDAK